MTPSADGGTITTLHASPWFEVMRRPDRIVQVARTERPFESIDEVELAHGQLAKVLDALPRHRLGILVDLRRAPSRNDPEFERVMPAHRQRMFGGFKRRAVLVRSAVGKLHVQRHARQDGHDLSVFTDVKAALEFLSGT